MYCDPCILVCVGPAHSIISALSKLTLLSSPKEQEASQSAKADPFVWVEGDGG